jgi:hypothetical protein
MRQLFSGDGIAEAAVFQSLLRRPSGDLRTAQKILDLTALVP